MSYHNILWYPDLGYRCWCTCVLRYTHLWARHSISVATRGGEFVFYFPTNGEDHHPDPVKRRERGVHSSTPPSQLLAIWSNEQWPHHKSRCRPSDGLRGAPWRLCAASHYVLEQIYVLQGCQCLYTPFSLFTSIYTPNARTPIRGSLRGCERHYAFSNDVQTLCEALRGPTSRFLSERQNIRRTCEFPLQFSWQPVRVFLCCCLNVICSMKSPQGL